MDEFFGCGEAELGEDVALNGWGCGCSERDDWGGTQGGKVLAEHAVVRAKVVSPLGDAVGFIDGD